MEIIGEPGPLVAAAIVAAMLRLEEEHAAVQAIPPVRPGQGRWVLSGLPRKVESPFATRQSPTGEGWSLSDSPEGDEPGR
jgi:hypothetical protein